AIRVWAVVSLSCAVLNSSGAPAGAPACCASSTARSACETFAFASGPLLAQPTATSAARAEPATRPRWGWRVWSPPSDLLCRAVSSGGHPHSTSRGRALTLEDLSIALPLPSRVYRIQRAGVSLISAFRACHRRHRGGDFLE